MFAVHQIEWFSEHCFFKFIFIDDKKILNFDIDSFRFRERFENLSRDNWMLKNEVTCSL